MMEGLSQEKPVPILPYDIMTDFYLRIKKAWVLLGELLFLVAPGMS
jgi:hypothetical protein